jgi:hypothetical protein
MAGFNDAAGGTSNAGDGDTESYKHIFTSPVIPPASAGGKEAWNWKQVQPNEFVVIYRSREGYFRSPPQPAGMRLKELLDMCGMSRGRLIPVDTQQAGHNTDSILDDPAQSIPHGMYRLVLAHDAAEKRAHRTGLAFRILDSETTAKYGSFQQQMPIISFYPGRVPTALHGIVILYSSHTARDRQILRMPFPQGTTMEGISRALCRSNFTLRKIAENPVELAYQASFVVPNGDYHLIQPQVIIKRDLYHHTFIIDSQYVVAVVGGFPFFSHR